MRKRRVSDDWTPWLRRLAGATFVLAALVVLAGSIVRMTGSGMGCPDWPKCFGLTIPPTSSQQVHWKTGVDYDRGRMLVEHDTLWVATAPHHAQMSFLEDRNSGLWTPYTKHQHIAFNATHTWVEFINRLLGALTGLPALMFFGMAILQGWQRKRWKPLGYATATLLLLAVVAWMGKRVVEGNLIPFSITLHMVGAVAILLILIGALSHLSPPEQPVFWKGRRWLWVAAVLTGLQILGGTQVREQVDVLVHAGVLRSDWLEALPAWWKLHRTGSWLVLGLQVLWAWPLRRVVSMRGRYARLVLGFVLAQMMTGFIFIWAGMPAWAQPIHLVLALAILGTNTWVLMRFRAQP